jgi:hypothetical protein
MTIKDNWHGQTKHETLWGKLWVKGKSCPATVKCIPDDYIPVEDTEGKVKDFVKSELGIEDEINFHVVHRLKPKQDRSPRGIVTKFERRKDRNKVLSKAIAKLKNSKQFIVHEQYPI